MPPFAIGDRVKLNSNPAETGVVTQIIESPLPNLTQYKLTFPNNETKIVLGSDLSLVNKTPFKFQLNEIVKLDW